MALPLFVNPKNQEIITAGVSYTIKATSAGDSSMNLYTNGTLIGAMTFTGGFWQYNWTPASVTPDAKLTVVGNSSGTSAILAVVVAEVNGINTNLGAWSGNGRILASGGYPDPDGGSNAFACTQTSATSGQSYFVNPTLSGTVSDVFNSYEIWVAVIPGTNTTTMLAMNNTAGGFIMNFADGHVGENTASSCFSWIAETRTVSGLTWYRVQWVLSASSATHGSMYTYITGDIQNSNFTPVVGHGLYLYKPRAVSTTHFVPTNFQKLAVYYDSTQGTLGSANGYKRYYSKHPNVDDIGAMAGGPGGVEWRVVTPPGWTQQSNLPVVLWLMPIAVGGEAGESATYTMTVDNYAALYNVVCIQPFDRSGGYWWGEFDNGTHKLMEFLWRVLIPWARLHLGISSLRNDTMAIGYSKSGNAILASLVLYSDVLGAAVVWDQAALAVYPYGNSDLSYNNKAIYDAHDFLQIVAADPTKLNPLKDFRRLYLDGYYTWGADQLAVKSVLDSNGVPYRYRRVLGSQHSWGSSTSGNLWTQDAMSNLMAMHSAIVNPSARSSMFF